MFNFTDQIVIVTGGTRGIGKGISNAFLNSGARVIATYKSNDIAANEFKESLKEKKDNLILKKFDVSDSTSVEEFWIDILSNIHRIHILVNNSGIRKDNLTPIMPDEDWNQVLQTNLSGSFYMTKRALNHFLEYRYGRIINISSIGGNLGLIGQANYAASKAGQVAMSKTISKEVAKRGITINNICPGFIETEFLAGISSEQLKEYKKQVPMKRFGKVEEVANAVLFLASKEASYITGASLEITGGL